MKIPRTAASAAAVLFVLALLPASATAHPGHVREAPSEDPLTMARGIAVHPESNEETPAYEASENLDLVDHHWFPEGSDMFFQRREGLQILDGERVNGVRDYLFAGGDAHSSADHGAMHIFDVTDPEDPVHLVDIGCKGYHAEVAVYENYMFQGVDTTGSAGCTEEARERYDPHGLDQANEPGIRIFDVTDPANPVIVRFIDREELQGWGVHNLTVVPWAGLLYLAPSDFYDVPPRWGYVDLNDPDLPVHMVGMPADEKGAPAPASCHDIGLDPDRELAFCAAVEQTYIWDISDPTAPETIATIYNPAITIHHGARLAPDGTTLVLNDELAGAAFSPGCLGPLDQGTVGALWFYDTTDPTLPLLEGSFSTEELSTATLCTSHFYNFVPGTTYLVVGWYESGIIVVDYGDPAGAYEHAYLRPEGGASFWSAYYWRGYVYGNSRTRSEDGNGGGLWVASVEGIEDVAPAPQDEGTSWIRWTSRAPNGVAHGVRGTRPERTEGRPSSILTAPGSSLLRVM